jgi:hypothetical protein
MIGPDRFKVELDLEDERPPLVLWFTNKALRVISEKLKFDLPLGNAYDVLAEHLLITTQATYIWAARLWENPGITEKEISERLDRSPLHSNARADVVTRGMWLAVYGITPEEAMEKIKAARDAAATDPPEPTALNGTGTTASSSPSVNSDYP